MWLQLCLCADLRSVQCHPGPRGHRSGPCWERRHHSRGEIFREAAPSSTELHYSELLSTINCLEMLNQNICSTTNAQTLYWQAKPKQIFLREVYIETMTSLLKDSAISCYSYHPIQLIFCLSFNRSSTGFWSWVSLDQRDMSSVIRRRWMAGNSGKSYSFSKENVCWLGFIDHLGGGGGSEPLCNSGQSDQLPSLHHQSDEQECRWCHRPGQEERWAPTPVSIWRVFNGSKPSGNIQGWITTMEEHSEAVWSNSIKMRYYY